MNFLMWQKLKMHMHVHYVGHAYTLYHVLCEHYLLTPDWLIDTENSDVSI